MTKEEAIRRLKRIADNEAYADKFQDACRLAVEALEKKTPKKTTIDEYDDGTYSYICPCGAEVEENQAYCDICGQALDWSDA